ncbi:unnamed protein product [Cylicocyclus nassatus]|uniref:G domain-containing protein n=1 Tax=Cylicocyclus nassatus TaxID=53992 RepID=A0AA36HEH5_CYLNA|nr:unnamed protein product [Cylicocyclus nassatus]
MDKENANLDTKPVDSVSHKSSYVEEVEVQKRTSTTEYNSSQLVHKVEVNADSIVLEEPPEPHPRRSFTEHNEQNENKQESRRSTVNGSKDEEDLMATVFGAVKLPEVSYGNAQATSTLDSSDHDHAIKHIDDVLAGEDAYHSEDHTPVMTARSVSSQRSSRVAANHYDDEPVKLRHNRDYSESHSPSEKHLSYGSPPVASRRVSHADRLRTMTYDSIVSTAESRVGGFDVHNEDGTYTGDEINLNHNEVAYVRPERIETTSITETPEYKIYTSGTGETIRLRRLNEEVAQARNRQYELAALVERERREVERLRQQKQQRLAREAAARVHPTAKVQPAARVQPTARVQAVQPLPFAARAPNRVGPARSVSSTTTERRSYDSSGTIDSIYDEEPVKISPVAQRILNNGKVVATIGNINMVVPEMVMVKGLSATATINKIVVGGEQDPTDEDKTILLFGPIRSGKTTTINSMLNYLYDVKRENHFRFVLDVQPAKTTKLTSYVFHNTVLPFSVTIVDTPGVPRSNSDLVSNLVKTWFEEELREAGTFRLDAISIVLKSDERNLGWPFINELAAVKHMLGDDLKTNVLPIITNAEVLSFKSSVPKKVQVLPQPLAVRSLALANITFVEYYKLNNVGFVPMPNDISKLQHNLFFSHGMASLEAYFRDLQELIHPLLAVLRGTRLIKTRLY